MSRRAPTEPGAESLHMVCGLPWSQHGSYRVTKKGDVQQICPDEPRSIWETDPLRDRPHGTLLSDEVDPQSAYYDGLQP